MQTVNTHTIQKYKEKAAKMVRKYKIKVTFKQLTKVGHVTVHRFSIAS